MTETAKPPDSPRGETAKPPYSPRGETAKPPYSPRGETARRLTSGGASAPLRRAEPPTLPESAADPRDGSSGPGRGSVSGRGGAPSVGGAGLRQWAGRGSVSGRGGAPSVGGPPSLKRRVGFTSQGVGWSLASQNQPSGPCSLGLLTSARTSSLARFPDPAGAPDPWSRRILLTSRSRLSC